MRHSLTRTLLTLSVLMPIAGLSLAACQAVTGRTTGQFVDDAATTARVKTALAGVKVSTLTRVDVDTRNGIVYLTGVVEDEATRQRLLETAHNAVPGKPVVSQLQIAGRPAPAEPPAASPPTPPAAR